MNIDLRYCRKCKRNTLQILQKVLTYEASRSLGQYSRWVEKTGGTFDWKKEQEDLLLDVWYCPCCGKKWVEVEPSRPDKYMAEFKEHLAQVIIRRE